MANTDRPNGFRPVESQLGADWNGLLRKYPAADRSGDTTNDHGDIYIGDPVALNAAGEVLPANSGDTILGVVMGVGTQGADFGNDSGAYDPDNLNKTYLGAAESGDVWVVPAEGVLFEVQTAIDLDLNPGALADITLAAATAHGSQTTGISSVELTTASNNDVKVVEDVTTPDNDTSLANARHQVKFQTTENTL